MEEQRFLERDRLFFHLNVVQQGAILALGQGIFMNRNGGRNLTTEDAHLIIGQVENHALVETILGQLVEGKWLIVEADVTFFSPEVEKFVIIKLAQMVLVHFQEEEQEKTEGRKEVTRRKSRH